MLSFQGQKRLRISEKTGSLHTSGQKRLITTIKIRINKLQLKCYSGVHFTILHTSFLPRKEIWCSYLHPRKEIWASYLHPRKEIWASFFFISKTTDEKKNANAFNERREYWVTCYVKSCVNMWTVCAQPDGSKSLLQSTGSSPSHFKSTLHISNYQAWTFIQAFTML